jgi:DNA polymerase III delta subunit
VSSATASGSEVSEAIKPAYLIAGTDGGKIDAALARLRARAEREGGPGALQSFGSGVGSGPPDAQALAASVPSMSLISSSRYLLADGVERWTTKDAQPVIEALACLPPDVTVVLLAREAAPKAKAPRGLSEAVEAAGGEVIRYLAPKPRELAGNLVSEAAKRGFRLEPEAARLLIDRLGEGTLRLANELDRLALWAGPDGEVNLADLEAMLVDTSEEAAWALSDAIVAQDAAAALRAAERLAAQGEAVTPLVYQAGRRLREAHSALVELEAGRSQKRVEADLRMHPYAAKMLMRRLRGTSPTELRAAACAIADLEWWTRGGSEYPEDVALALAVWRASGAAAGAS